MLFSSLPKKPAEEKKLPEISEEERLETLLSKIDGVGKVDVLVTYYGSGEKRVAAPDRSRRRKAQTGRLYYQTEALLSRRRAIRRLRGWWSLRRVQKAQKSGRKF